MNLLSDEQTFKRAALARWEQAAQGWNDHTDGPTDKTSMEIPMRLAIIAALSFAAAPASAQDPLHTDPGKYKPILENECVRVLEYNDRPGDRTHQHRHPAFVLYALSGFKRALTLPDGKVLRREFKPGDVMWSEEQTHIGENVGDTPTRVIIVELKKQREGCAKP